ncbi:MAG: hypothetical protein ACP5J0_03205 [Pyrobaculum sp.]|jgi:hypothetical protein
MFDEKTYRLLSDLLDLCRGEGFYRSYKDLCIAARIAMLNVKGRGVKLRPSLLRLSELSDAKTAANLLNRFKKEIGAVADGAALKYAAADYVYKRLAALI